MNTTTPAHLIRKMLPSLLAIVVCATGPLAHAQLVAAVLPSSRSAEVGGTVTVFATVINGGAEAATGCSIGAPEELVGNFSFQTTDPVTNLPTGVANALVDLAPGVAQSFVLSLTPMAILDSLDASFSFSCTSGAMAQPISGVNTLLLSASDTPVVDIIALAATAANNGVLGINNSAGAFSLATVNLGAGDTVTVNADTGGVDLPVVLSLCETNPATGACLASPGESVQVEVVSGATPTFSIFSSATDAIANDPAINRVFISFVDSNGIVRGGTSVGIENELDFESSLTEGAFDAIFSTLANINSMASDSIDTTTPCTTGQIVSVGTVDTSGDVSTTTQIVTFDNCDGVIGQIESVATIETIGDSISLNQVQNGSFSTPECAVVSFSELRFQAVLDTLGSQEGLFGDSALGISGEISGVCEGQNFSCVLDDASFSDEAELDDSCSVSP